MKLVKSLLLGSAAGLVAVAGAQAADLPVKKAVPVDYVRVCATYGAGYFFLPGTDTCLRISGYLQADYLYLEQDRDDFDETGFRARARLNFDFRQPTEFGLLRAFIRGEFRRNTGTFVGGGQTGVAFDAFGNATLFGTEPTDTTLLHLGYLQFGGLSAGRVQSFYDFWPNDNAFTTLFGVSDTKTQAIAYTFTFGGGWSATIAMEDPQERRSFASPNRLFGGAAPAGFVFPAGSAFPVALAPAGTDVPDVVANIRLDQAWGAFQLSGALHEVEAVNLFTPIGFPAGTFVNPDSELGWAVQAGVNFKLPFLGAGDQLWLQASFADGALGYTHSSPFTGVRSGSFRLRQAEAFINPFTGDVETAESWSVSGALHHFWLPNLRSMFFAAYSEIDYGAGASAIGFAPATATAVTFGFTDTKILEIGANLVWSPVKQLDIGVEAVYRNVEVAGRTPVTVAPIVGPGFRALDPRFDNVGDESVWEARLRIQRDF